MGRIGFILVLIGAYSLWHLPVLRKHSNEFFWLATVICLASLLFTTIEYLFSEPTQLYLSLVFNVGSTWILALYLNWRAYKIKHRVPRNKIQAFTTEVNDMIEELKHGI